jgi:hypothetical protein
MRNKYTNILAVAAVLFTTSSTHAFMLSSLTPSTTTTTSSTHPTTTTTTTLHGIFDRFQSGGSGNSKESLNEQWEAQQRILQMRNKSPQERQKYFEQIEKRREDASKKQKEMWSWQTKNYAKGQDPIDEWRKRRADGTISDLENQYGDPKKGGRDSDSRCEFWCGWRVWCGG